MHAQDQTVQTLHVYENLVQVPVLTLTAERKELPPDAPPLHFTISVDSGETFSATYTRLEGSDPIDLALVLDVTGSQDALKVFMDRSLGSMAARDLRPADRVSVYAVDCQVVRTLRTGQPDGPTVQKAVSDAIGSKAVHESSLKPAGCLHRMKLWDSLAFVCGQMANDAGRRVMLVLTDGDDSKSIRRWTDVRKIANGTGVAIFGITASSPDPKVFSNSHANPSFWNPDPRIDDPYQNVRHFYAPTSHEDRLDMLTQLTGGLLLSAAAEPYFPEQLDRFVAMLRNRVIVEFPRPDTLGPGRHGFRVGVSESDAFVRAAGISLPIASEAEREGPNGVPRDPAHAPQVGSRRVLESPK